MNIKIILPALLLLMLSSSKSVSADESSWYLDQDTTSMGKMTIYISADALRLDLDRIKSTLVMKSPDWRVHMFQAKKRLIYECDADQFEGQRHAHNYVTFVAPSRGDFKTQFVNNETFAGMTAKHYVCKLTAQQAGLTEIKAAEYWIGPQKISPKAAHVLERLMNLPMITGLPVGFFTTSTNGYKYRDLNTRWAKNLRLESNTFVIPSGYTKISKAFDFWDAALGTQARAGSLLEMIK